MSDGLAPLVEIDELVREQMEKWDVPGLSVGIYRDGEVETAGYGIASVETQQPVVPETLFQIGSISKIFTATLVMTVVDEGLIDLDSPVIRYVPDLPLTDEKARNSITVRHLVTHLSGFYGDRFDDQGNGEDALAKAVAAFRDLPQQTAPGEVFTYCNAGFDLAGRAVELALGQPFEHAMRERVFKPLGLDRTTYFAHEAIRHAVSVGHSRPPGATNQVADPWPIPRRSNSAGGISSNAAELLRFAVSHLQKGEFEGKRILSEASAEAMQTVQTPAYFGRSWGLGWVVHESDGVKIVEHGGATNGFTARLILIPQHRFAISILTNSDHGSAAHGAVAGTVLERFFGLKEPVRPHINLGDDTLDRFAGSYKFGLADMTLTVKDGGYLAERLTHNAFNDGHVVQEPLRLLPIAESVFVVEGGELHGSYLEALLNADGEVRFLRFGGRLGRPI